MSYRIPKKFHLPLRGIVAATAIAYGWPALGYATTHLVTQCSDVAITPQCDGFEDGTVRKAMFCAQDRDIVDLSQLRACTITLAAPLVDYANNIHLVGPGREELAIDGAAKWRIVHNGNGKLFVSDMTIENGYFNNTYAYGGGGCIYANSDVLLTNIVVTDCQTKSTNVPARGGAIFAGHAASVTASEIRLSSVSSSNDTSFGGGVDAPSVFLANSTVTMNSAKGSHGYGGGINAQTIQSYYSTISSNKAGTAAGVNAAYCAVTNSTVSQNIAQGNVGGLKCFTRATVRSSTIVENTAKYSSQGAAGLSAGSVSINSTIVAKNYVATTPSDLQANNFLSGASNLIQSLVGNAILPADTLTKDPNIGPLQDNGGDTPTHALLPGSPAINGGNNDFSLAHDQRNFPRVVGSLPDIGAFETDTLFVGSFERP